MKFISSCMIIQDSGATARAAEKKIGNPWIRENLVITLAYDRTATVRTDSEGRGKKNSVA